MKNQEIKFKGNKINYSIIIGKNVLKVLPNKIKLLWILCVLSFVFSATLDNLTTAIVMSALLTKIIEDKKDLWLFAGMVIISANAGGAWSPIGDITTIMLWIGGQITAVNIITSIILPSFVCMIVPVNVKMWLFWTSVTSFSFQDSCK